LLERPSRGETKTRGRMQQGWGKCKERQEKLGSEMYKKNCKDNKVEDKGRETFFFFRGS